MPRELRRCNAERKFYHEDCGDVRKIFNLWWEWRRTKEDRRSGDYLKFWLGPVSGLQKQNEAKKKKKTSVFAEKNSTVAYVSMQTQPSSSLCIIPLFHRFRNKRKRKEAYYIFIHEHCVFFFLTRYRTLTAGFRFKVFVLLEQKWHQSKRSLSSVLVMHSYREKDIDIM